MHARAVQALVVVFPENLPVALDVLLQHVTDHELFERPRIEPAQRQIEYLLESRRILGQRDEYETVPLPDADLVQRIVGHIEAAGMRLGGGAQQIALAGCRPTRGTGR